MITDKEKRDIDQALDEVEEAIRRHNQWLEEQINKLEARQKEELWKNKP